MTLNIFLTIVELLHDSLIQITKTKHSGRFSWIGFNYVKATEQLQGNSLLFSTNSSGISGTHLFDQTLEGQKAGYTLEPAGAFKIGTPGSAVWRLNHRAITQKNIDRWFRWFKTTSWPQSWFSFLSFQGWSNEYQEFLGTYWLILNCLHEWF